MKRFKHSGTLGDIIYSLPIMKHFGGGEFYLHLNQVNWIGQYYYKTPPQPYHNGKMDEKDFKFLAPLLRAQSYISKVDILDLKTTEITHNLDNFRPLFVGHPANYVTTYCMAFNIQDKNIIDRMNTEPWLTVPTAIKLDGKPYVINRTSRGWSPKERSPQWDLWLEKELDKSSVFIGLSDEYEEFKKFSGWNLDYYPVKDMLELAQVIAGSEMFIGNQSSALALAQGLGVNYIFERRQDLPIERNESFFPKHEHGNYF